MNSVANGKVTKFTPFKKVYIQPAAGDAGGALGAAYTTWHKILKKDKIYYETCILGYSFSNDQISLVLDREKID